MSNNMTSRLTKILLGSLNETLIWKFGVLRLIFVNEKGEEEIHSTCTWQPAAPRRPWRMLGVVKV